MNDEILDVLKSVERWLRIGNLQRLNEILREEFSEEADSDKKKKVAYLLSDGVRATRTIARHRDVKKSSRTISNWWRGWVAKGLADPASGRKPAVALWRDELATLFELEFPEEESSNEPEQN